jgi:hypothetical protein
MLLQQTQNAVAELRASGAGFGDHRANHTVFDSFGSPAGVEQFDFQMHDVADVALFSMEEELTGMPHVQEVFPEKPHNVNIIAHCDPEEGSDPKELVNGRRLVVANLFDSMKESLMYGDGVKLYTTGQHDPLLAGREVRHLEGTEEPLQAAESIARLCTNGLSVVISTFKNLPLEGATTGSYPMTVGVKANHIWDRELPANVGPWDTGEPDIPVVHTDDSRFGKKPSKELMEYRERQNARHEQTVTRLQNAGLKMADAIFAREFAPLGFDLQAVDQSIAQAVRLASR